MGGGRRQAALSGKRERLGAEIRLRNDELRTLHPLLIKRLDEGTNNLRTDFAGRVKKFGKRWEQLYNRTNRETEIEERGSSGTEPTGLRLRAQQNSLACNAKNLAAGQTTSHTKPNS